MQPNHLLTDGSQLKTISQTANARPRKHPPAPASVILSSLNATKNSNANRPDNAVAVMRAQFFPLRIITDIAIRLPPIKRPKTASEPSSVSAPKTISPPSTYPSISATIAKPGRLTNSLIFVFSFTLLSFVSSRKRKGAIPVGVSDETLPKALSHAALPLTRCRPPARWQSPNRCSSNEECPMPI